MDLVYEWLDAIQVACSSSLICKRGRLHEFARFVSFVGVWVRVYDVVLGDSDVLLSSVLLTPGCWCWGCCCWLLWFGCWTVGFELRLWFWGFRSELLSFSCWDVVSDDDMALCTDAPRLFKIRLLLCCTWLGDVAVRILFSFLTDKLLLLLLLFRSRFVSVFFFDSGSWATGVEYGFSGDTGSLLFVVFGMLLFTWAGDNGTEIESLLFWFGFCELACRIRCCCCWWDRSMVDCCTVWLAIGVNPFACDVSHIEGKSVLLVSALQKSMLSIETSWSLTTRKLTGIGRDFASL